MHQCGPAALASLLHWSGSAITPESLAAQVYLPAREGSLQAELLAAARRAGRIPYVLAPAPADLLAEVAAGHPVLVLQNLGLAWLPRWHYAVVIGYDLEADSVTLHSGRARAHVTALDTFLRTWQRGGRWALVVLPPERLPATARALPYVAAVSGLEGLGQWAAAATAYHTALGRWPDSLGAWLGLANARHGAGDTAGAVAALREALRHHPDAALVHNNLAHLLLEQGDLTAALYHARRAVALAGDRLPAAQQTLEAIRQRRP